MSSAVTSKIKEKIYLNSFSFGVRFNNDIKLLPEFSKYLFRSNFMRIEISKTASGVTRFNLSKARFRKILIPTPPHPVVGWVYEIDVEEVRGNPSKYSELIKCLDDDVFDAKKSYVQMREYLYELQSKQKPTGDSLFDLF